MNSPREVNFKSWGNTPKSQSHSKVLKVKVIHSKSKQLKDSTFYISQYGLLTRDILNSNLNFTNQTSPKVIFGSGKELNNPLFNASEKIVRSKNHKGTAVSFNSSALKVVNSQIFKDTNHNKVDIVITKIQKQSQNNSHIEPELFHPKITSDNATSVNFLPKPKPIFSIEFDQQSQVFMLADEECRMGFFRKLEDPIVRINTLSIN